MKFHNKKIMAKLFFNKKANNFMSTLIWVVIIAFFFYELTTTLRNAYLHSKFEKRIANDTLTIKKLNTNVGDTDTTTNSANTGF